MSAWIGNGCGFWGDRIDAPLQLVQKEPNLGYLTLDYLSEMSLSIMAVQQEKNPEEGYAKDFIEVVGTLVPEWKKGRRFKVVTNAGGLNPRALAEKVRALCPSGMKIGIVTGDDVRSHFPELHTANAYLGAEPLVDALRGESDIVIAGRIADPSLTVACAKFHWGWNKSDFDLLAQATVAGHLIECGAQVTGGLMDDWLDEPDLEEMGYPIVEIQKDGSFYLRKPEGTGGKMTLRCIKEQLVYEMGDPGNYLSPDVTVNLLDVHIDESTLLIKGAVGKPPPLTYKVSGSVRKGWTASAEIGLVGRDLVEKGKKICAVIERRLEKRGLKLDQMVPSLIGVNGLSPYLQSDSFEALLRLSVQSVERHAVEAFTKEMAPFITCGPLGVCAYTGGRGHVRPHFCFKPLSIERSRVAPKVEIVRCS